MKKLNILLLNPPFNQIVIRDYYCSKTSRTNYIYPPLDLLMQSGWLGEKNNLFLIDAIADKLGDRRTIEKIQQSDIDVILFITGSVSYKKDFEFIKKVREIISLKNRNIKIIGSGDIFMERGIERLQENDFIDAIALDFTNRDILNYLNGNYENIENMVFRRKGKFEFINLPRKKYYEFELPTPMHELFLNKNYRMPFLRHRIFAPILTDFGCPFKCSFCIMSTLGYKYRTIDNVIEELNLLKKLNIQEIFFFDQTFGAKRERLIKLCQEMINRKYNFGWVCFSRVDIAEEETLKLMKESGCHTIIFGIESGSDEILKKYKKGYTTERIKETLRICSKLSIKTVGTFILGLPEETRETINDTINLACSIGCDYASFHIAVPRLGTELKKQLCEEHFISDSLDAMDQSGSFIAMSTKFLSKKEVLEYRKKAHISFYLRPSFIFKKIMKIKSLHHLKSEIEHGFQLIRRNL